MPVSVTGGKRFSPAAERNRDAILARLVDWLPATGTVLEIASGSGQHAVHFAAALPGLDWQPSDIDPDAIESIRAWSEEAGLPNVRAPLRLDVTESPWPAPRVAAILCCNMIHISPWASTLGLCRGAGETLLPGGSLILYGPFMRDGRHTAPSNEAFDQSLRQRDPDWGVRDLGDVRDAAAGHGMTLRDIVEMPANNLMLRFEAGA